MLNQTSTPKVSRKCRRWHGFLSGEVRQLDLTTYNIHLMALHRLHAQDRRQKSKASQNIHLGSTDMNDSHSSMIMPMPFVSYANHDSHDSSVWLRYSHGLLTPNGSKYLGDVQNHRSSLTRYSMSPYPTLQSIIRELLPRTVLVVGPIFIFLIQEVEAPLSPGELVDTSSERWSASVVPTKPPTRFKRIISTPF